MCGINDYPKLEGLCAVGCLVGLCALTAGVRPLAAFCLVGVLVGQVLLFGDKMVKRCKAFDALYNSKGDGGE